MHMPKLYIYIYIYVYIVLKQNTVPLYSTPSPLKCAGAFLELIACIQLRDLMGLLIWYMRCCLCRRRTYICQRVYT